MMTWTFHGFRLTGMNPTSLLAYPTQRSTSILIKNLNKMTTNNLAVTFSRNVPVYSQSSQFSSSSSWNRNYSQYSRPKLNQNLMTLSPPLYAAYSTFVATLPELDPVQPSLKGAFPCSITTGAAWAPKRPRANLPTWCLADCGEDAFFTSTVDNKYCIGIADGVGGWSEVGVDPSQFAWELMNKCQAQFESQDFIGKVEPVDILDSSYSLLKQENKVKAGSSTACLAIIDTETGILNSVNLGDSGYIIIRKGTTVYRAAETTHYFNAPYQLSIIPQEMNKGNHILNTPREGKQAKLQLEHGDIIVFGTDGLFDNLFNQDIEHEIKVNEPENIESLLLSTKKNQDLLKGFTNKVAGSLVKLARLRAKDSTKDSPFSTEATKHGYRYRGGKMDDITVVVALVTMKQPTTHI